MHKFQIGQTVELDVGVLRSSAPGAYEIRQLIPASDRDPEDPCYRSKSIAEALELSARQSELTLSGRAFA